MALLSTRLRLWWGDSTGASASANFTHYTFPLYRREEEETAAVQLPTELYNCQARTKREEKKEKKEKKKGNTV